jgi:hypothetical protein
MRHLAAAAVLALAPSAALAGGPALPVPLGRPAPDPALSRRMDSDVAFSAAGPDDYQDLVLKAEAGKDYWLGLSATYGVRVEVRDPAGGLVASRAIASDNRGDEQQDGLELHARAAGTYVARVWVLGSDGYPASTYAWFWPDCRGGPRTGCSIRPGRTEAGSWGGRSDGDGFVVEAPPGRYRVTLANTCCETLTSIALLDGRGRTLASHGTRRSGPGRGTRSFGFTLPAEGGPYLLKAAANPSVPDTRGTYTLSLAAR